jgi:hypothetical protein
MVTAMNGVQGSTGVIRSAPAQVKTITTTAKQEADIPRRRNAIQDANATLDVLITLMPRKIPQLSPRANHSKGVSK